MPRPQTAADLVKGLRAYHAVLSLSVAMGGDEPGLDLIYSAAALIEAQAEYIEALRRCDCIREPGNQKCLNEAFAAISKLSALESDSPKERNPDGR